MKKKECYSHSFSIYSYRQDFTVAVIWQVYCRNESAAHHNDRCHTGSTMVSSLYKTGSQNLIECWRNTIRFSTLKLTKYLCTLATFIPRERQFSKTWINLEEKKSALGHAVLNFKDCQDIWIEAQCFHHLWRWNWQSFEMSARKIQTPGNHPKEYKFRTRRKFETNFQVICQIWVFMFNVRMLVGYKMPVLIGLFGHSCAKLKSYFVPSLKRQLMK